MHLSTKSFHYLWVINIQWWEKCDFYQNCYFSRKRYETGRGCYGSLIGRYRLPIDPCQCQWPWKAGCKGSNFFLADLHNYARMGWPWMTKFGMVTQMWRSIFLGSAMLLIPRRETPAYPKKLGPTFTHTHEKRQPNFAWWSVWGKFLQCRPRMPTQDQFAVANVLLYVAVECSQNRCLG